MLPQKVKEFINKVQEATENGEIKWVSDLNEAEVTGRYKGNSIAIRYRFDEIEEEGVFYLRIIDKNKKTGAFQASQAYKNDYEKIRILFDMAQACDLDLEI